jgi:DNA-binding GntR family transcriptional regulator
MPRTSSRASSSRASSSRAASSRTSRSEGPGTARDVVATSEENVEADSAPASLYDLLRADVLAGVFAVGAPLQEVQLAERYGVSRTPVREALGRLEHDGLAEHTGRGFRIRSGTGEDVVEIYEARIGLEAQAAARATERRTELDLARLHHLHDLAGAAAGAGDADAERAHNSAWHEALWRASHNRTIEALLTRLIAQLRIYDRGTHESAADLELSRAEHARIVEALELRRADEAQQLITAHLVRSREVRLQRVVRDGVPPR